MRGLDPADIATNGESISPFEVQYVPPMHSFHGVSVVGMHFRWWESREMVSNYVFFVLSIIACIPTCLPTNQLVVTSPYQRDAPFVKGGVLSSVHPTVCNGSSPFLWSLKVSKCINPRSF